MSIDSTDYSLDDDELEVLVVPNWNTETKPLNRIKNTSISFDSLWEDTESTLSNLSPPKVPSPPQRKSKEHIRIHHQTQADALVKQALERRLDPPKTKAYHQLQLKKLTQENNQLKTIHHHTLDRTRQVKSRSDTLLAQLTQELAQLKIKPKPVVIHRQVKSDQEIRLLKKRLAVLIESKKRAEGVRDRLAIEAQVGSEAALAAQAQYRHLIQSLRKASNEGLYLNLASLEKILSPHLCISHGTIK